MWSIVIPTLLRNKLLLNQLLDQIILIEQYINIEILLIVDAASKDINFEIKKKYEKYLKVIYSDKNGPGLLRNFGLKRALGEYISFFDDDDELIFKNSTIKFESDIVLFEFIHSSEVFSNKKLLNIIKNENLINTKSVCLKAYEIKYIFSYCQPFAIRRNILHSNNIKFFDSYIMEDFDFISQIFSAVYTVSVFDDIKYKYVSHQNSTKSLTGISIYDSACTIANRIKKRIGYSNSIDYTKMEYDYAISIKRFRFIESFDYVISSSEDYLYLNNLIKNTKELNDLLLIYCYNNTSLKLFNILNKKNSYIFDDNIQNSVEKGIKIVSTDEILNCLRPEMNLQIFIAHAHPKVRVKAMQLFDDKFCNFSILN